MSWTLFTANVLKSLISGQYSTDPDEFAEFYANEYDSCIKRGGDMLYGVNIINGNVQGMSDVLKAAFKKGKENSDENFNLLAEIYPAAFDAYWMGAEMSPLPNPLLKPGGWPSTPPAPGTIQNIGPEPTTLAASAAKNKAEVEAMKQLEDALKEQTVTLPGVPPIPDITIPVYETAMSIIEKKKPKSDLQITDEIKNNPIIKNAIVIIKKLKQVKKKKPSTGSQMKKSIKIPFPDLPKKKDIIEKAKDKLIEVAIETIKEPIVAAIEEIILAPIISSIEVALSLANNIPNPKPTKEQIKEFIKDKKDKKTTKINLEDYISLPYIPTKEDFEKMVDEKTPTKEELKAMAYDMVKDKIPDIPNIHFVPPTLVFNAPSLILLNPFISLARTHLMGTGGTMYVMAQYPPPAPPAPAILNWSGYRVVG
jgi:hypothetical protein